MITVNNHTFTSAYLNKFNKQLKHQFAAWDITDISQAFADESPKQRSSQLSSALSPLSEIALKAAGEACNLDWKHEGALEYDSILNGIPVEHKFSCNENNSWCGHPYSNKVHWHLLTRVLVEGTKVSRCFIGFVDVSTLTSGWSKNKSLTTSFSSLTIRNEDAHKVHTLCGKITPNTFRKNTKWSKVILT